MTILDEIVAVKRESMSRLTRQDRDAMRRAADSKDADLRASGRDFAASIRAAAPMAVIAEVKKASPSAGVIAESFDATAIATAYEKAGAACISVLTDEPYFKGSMDDLRAVRAAVGVPVLRKDFVVDPFQVDEARAAGADAVLLIAECLPQPELESLHGAICERGMCPLVELYDEANVELVLALKPTLVGVNNRDLRTFEVDTARSRRLRSLFPPDVLFVSESGIRGGEETADLAEANVDAVLVGETLMRADDVAAKVAELGLRTV